MGPALLARSADDGDDDGDIDDDDDGLAATVVAGTYSSSLRVVGTLGWQAPELLRESMHRSSGGMM